ncbi:NEK kinase [Fusarium pseudoanthophilum]|uniref:non-specific serine/threonine protein kinase n=1 Tax=Fusarium pseudoanthophilum TaxID=48495 RepID=A0A8H5PI94_9HYPO|nr:NEK kinase [Fusarium pseudoanthophilum]
MSDYRLAHEILGMAGNGFDISAIDEETFGMARELYENCIPIQISEVDRLRFQTITESAKGNPNYTIKFSDIKGLAHWLYKRFRRDKEQRKQVQRAINKAIQHFRSENDVTTASKSLEQTWGGDAFTVSTLFLSAVFSNSVSFLSPELTYCFNLDTRFTGHDSETSRDAKLYRKLDGRIGRTIRRITREQREKRPPRIPCPITRPEVEQVAYVLRRLADLKDSYYDPKLITRGPRLNLSGIFQAEVTNPKKNPFPNVSHPLAMKEQSIIADHRIIDYLNEVRISRQFGLANVIAFRGWTYTNQHIRIVMDRMETDLENRLGDKGTWKTRPFKPNCNSKPLLNIFLDKEDNVVLGDFGVSKQARDGFETTLATFTGTIAYMAPEVLDARPKATAYTSKADVWALGCVLYRMLSGHPLIEPHDDKNRVIAAVSDFKKSRMDNLRRPERPKEYQYEFLDGLLDCDESTRLSVSDALSKCSVWEGY